MCGEREKQRKPREKLNEKTTNRFSYVFTGKNATSQGSARGNIQRNKSSGYICDIHVITHFSAK